MADFSVVEPSMSYTGNLTPNASFLGPFFDVTQYTSVTTTAIAAVPPAVVNAIQYEWSTDGINLDSTMPFGSDGSTQQTVHSSVRAQYLRVRYTAGPAGLTGARVQTLLRNGPMNASVARVGLITGAPDALNTNAVALGKATTTFQAIKAYPDVTTPADFLFGVVPPPNRTNGLSITTTANLSAVNLDPNVAQATRRFATIHNDTVRGNLMVRLGINPTLTVFDYKIPPQHSWSLPDSWVKYGASGAGRIIGIWDFADGVCHYHEAT